MSHSGSAFCHRSFFRSGIGDSVLRIPERGHDLDREPAAEPFVFGQEARLKEASDDVVAKQGLPHDVPGQ